MYLNRSAFIVLSLVFCHFAFSTQAQTGEGPARVFVQKSQTQPHSFNIDVIAQKPFELVSVRVADSEGVWGRYSIVNEPPSTEIGFQTASFRFLPKRYGLEIELDYGSGSQTHKAGPFSNELQKMVIVDRDGYPQRALMVEGDRWFLFGRIAGSSEISTGLVKYGGTPLGYYHVRNKDANAYNAKQEWEMPLAQWYTPSTYPEGVNGLHQGFEGTNYGIRQSHGCTRMPPWFAQTLFNWSETDTPVMFVGKEYQTEYDRGRFDVSDYRFFETMIRDTVYFHQSLQMGDETRTCFNPAEVEVINRMRPFQDGIMDACANFSRFSAGQAFLKVIDHYTELRKLQ